MSFKFYPKITNISGHFKFGCYYKLGNVSCLSSGKEQYAVFIVRNSQHYYVSSGAYGP